MNYRLMTLFLCVAWLSAASPALEPPAATERDAAASVVLQNATDQAWAWLRRNRPADPEGRRIWRLTRHKESLLGHHFTFTRVLDGIPVHGEEATVSLNKRDGLQYQGFLPEQSRLPPRRAAKNLLNADDALEIAWQDLDVRGDLGAEPRAARRYLYVDGRPRLVWLVEILTSEPQGDWAVFVDAVDGAVLNTHNRQRYHGRGEPRQAAELPPRNRAEAVAWFRTQRALRTAPARPAKRADGSATLFDPDPITTLGDFDLTDASPPEAFADAYFLRTLRDISTAEGRFHLSGPWVQIVDFEAPNTAPTTTADGFWQFARGQQGFNDAMSYYHIDENQRYLQKLGFVGATGIQDGPISVDADGRFGNDDSVYTSTQNTIAFGHGCVDDNEDADVIIHEYGHAIQFDVAPGFFSGGGDTFMLGEGFGDYWAGSWSLRSLQGLQVRPEWVFAWDAFGGCWAGRLLNDFEQKYDPEMTYFRHEHGQIWSTGAFQALLELMRRGIPREQVDQIVIESMFGLGRGVTAPQWSAAIVATAARLYPEGPHARVFQNAFARQNLVDPVAAYTYVSAHIPPASASWQSQVAVANPNREAATIIVTTYSDADGAFAEQARETHILAAGASLTLVPAGDGQRWLRLESSLPLAGHSLLSRHIDDTTGRESAALPLAALGASGQTFVLPHVPADRARFWSGWVLVNPVNREINLEIELIGERGGDLSRLLRDDAPFGLAPFQKWVGFLAEGPAGEPGLFDDTDSEERVAWVRIRSDQAVNSFQLYGYRADRGEAAVAAVAALPDQVRALQPINLATGELDWNGFAVVNPNDADADVNLVVYGAEGRIFAEETVRIPPRGKSLGLNIKGGVFAFPTDAPRIQVEGDAVHTLVARSDKPLRFFGLSGDHGNSTLDGAAAEGLVTHALFVQPAGSLSLFKAKIPGSVVLTHVYEDGETRVETLEMAVGEQRVISLESGLRSLELRGDFVVGSLQTNDPSRALTILPGQQIEIHHPQAP
ncbi:PepSY domain-containing protein [Acanthopleuribacter pedis]|uniref:PepSY domain-containing protein n=1 Tax=Acanthopleuribacter pedis TaxID=442870 RepID=A0A8J7Q4S7_9BACT|nr:PepSY domain-containing protein [Acanthopleuribacter pedis]MBO1318084.1 PepSY domain-containing protein [Acanthopleuribacter pedis]